MDSTHTLWDVIEEGKVLSPYTGANSSHIRKAILFEISEDTEDGTYPRVSDYTRLANQIENDGTSAWVNRLTRKRNKKTIEFYGCKIERSADYQDEAIIEFATPIPVVFGYVGDEPIIKEVSKIKGEFTHDWFWMKNGRQDKIANGFEIWFNIKEFLS
jgi:hypothetical protein